MELTHMVICSIPAPLPPPSKALRFAEMNSNSTSGKVEAIYIISTVGLSRASLSSQTDHCQECGGLGLGLDQRDGISVSRTSFCFPKI